MELNKIYNVNCFDFMRGGGLKDVDLVLTDPPYQFASKKLSAWGCLSENKLWKEITDNIWLEFDPIEMLECIREWMKKFNWYFFTNKTTLPKYIQWIEKYKYKWDLLLRLKPNPIPACKSHYLFDKEYIVYIHDSWTTFNHKLWYENYFTYQSYPIWKREYDHPTVKPQHLLDRMIKISSNEWDVVFDPYMWSWTTAVACKELNRNFIGCEINQKYCEIAEQRLSNTLHEQTLF